MSEKPSEILKPLQMAYYDTITETPEARTAGAKYLAARDAILDDIVSRLDAIDVEKIAADVYKRLMPPSPAPRDGQGWPRWVLYPDDGSLIGGVYRWDSADTGEYYDKNEGWLGTPLNDADRKNWSPPHAAEATHQKVIAKYPAIANRFPLPAAEAESRRVKGWLFGVDEWQLLDNGRIEHRLRGANMSGWKKSEREAAWLDTHTEVIFTREPTPTAK